MLNKPYLSVQPERMDKIWIFQFLINILILAFLIGTTVRIEYAHGYYGVLGNSYYQPTTSGYYNAGNTYSNTYTGSNTYAGYPYSYGSTSYAPSSYVFNASGYTPNNNTASAQSYYYGSNTSPSGTTGYTAQSSFYYPNNYAAQGTYSPYTSSTAQGYYSGGSSGYAASNNFSYAGSYAPASTSASYYYPAGTAYSPSTASTYYRGPYTTAGSNTYYPAAQTYYPAAAGYTAAAVTDITGSYQGRWVRNYSSTGAPISGRTTNSGGTMRSSNGTASSTYGSCGGGGGTNGSGFQPITLELTQVAAAVNGVVTFFSDNTVVKTIPVNGTLESAGVLSLNGTTAGSVADPILYGIKVTATVQGTSLQGAYTLINTATNTNIELGTFTASK